MKTKFDRLFKHWASKQTSANSVAILHTTHAIVCRHGNSTAPRTQLFPYTTCKTVLIGCFVCGLIHYAADVTVWKSSFAWVDSTVEYNLEGVLVGEVPPTEWVDEFTPGQPIRTSFNCSSWQFQTISIYFHVFYAVPHEYVRKMIFFFFSRLKK